MAIDPNILAEANKSDINLSCAAIDIPSPPDTMFFCLSECDKLPAVSVPMTFTRIIEARRDGEPTIAPIFVRVLGNKDFYIPSSKIANFEASHY